MPMRSLTAAELLDVWERGLTQPPPQRALLLLGATQPDRPLSAIGTLSVGQRDMHLLALREGLFGSQLASLAACPQCQLCVQIDLDVADLHQPAPDPIDTFTFTVGVYELTCRLPNTFDLIALAAQPDAATLRDRLIERCVLRATCGGQPSPIDPLPPDVLDALEDQLEQHDPQAQLQLALTCPQCQHTWLAAFDIVTFLWAEINAWATRLLHDVHTLALAYGWRERDILALSAFRRQTYLDLINA